MLKQILMGLLALVTLNGVVTAHADAASPPAAAEKAPDAQGQININTATEDELSQLPGVGASKAANVVAYRKRHGNFAHPEDIMKVKGFGRKVFARLKPFLATEGQSTYKNPKKTAPLVESMVPFAVR